MTVAAGLRQGVTQARIQLAPASLGQIRINLEHTDEGVVAKVVTDHQAAAQTLGQAGDELRRSFHDAGVNLVRLDIEARGDSASTGSDPNQSQSSGRANNAPTNDSASAPTSAEAAPGEQTLTLPSGVLVNVLA
jgi:flagellar hook-length control protein FliK